MEEGYPEMLRLTFDAESPPPDPIEGPPWDEFLSSVLTDDFIGQRGRATLHRQDRDDFVAFARGASDASRIIIGEPKVWVGVISVW